MSNDDLVRRFFRRHAGAAVAMYPTQEEFDAPDERREERLEWGVERPAEEWKPLPRPEAPARPGEYPERFIDATQHPRWTRLGLTGDGDGLKLFRNAVEYFR